MEFHSVEHASRVLQALYDQQLKGNHCDIILSPSSALSRLKSRETPAHRCVLSANSDYFRALFSCGLSDSSIDCVTVACSGSPETLRQVVRFMYTGDIRIDDESIEDILRLADYLGVTSLINFCCQYLSDMIDETTCLRIKVLVDTYNLEELNTTVMKYILPRWPRLINRPDVSELPREVFRNLIKSTGCTGFALESDVLAAITRWAEKRTYDDEVSHHGYDDLMACDTFESDSVKCVETTDKALSAYDHLDCIEFLYLTKHILRTRVLHSPNIVRWLEVYKPETLHEIQRALATCPHRRDVCDVILVKSQVTGNGGKVCLMFYVVENDEWKILESSDASIEFQGLESMVHHRNYMYFLCSKTEDMRGYVHGRREIKLFYRLCISGSSKQFGHLEVLRPPPTVRGQCRLESTAYGLFALDRYGIINEFCPRENRWSDALTANGFDSNASTCTLCCLPIPFNRRMYLLRTYSSGYSFQYSQKTFALYVFDAGHACWQLISEIEATELFPDSDTPSDDLNFYGYISSPGKITLTDELHHARATFDLQEGIWNLIETEVTRPDYFRGSVYGSVSVGCCVYCVGRHQFSEDGNVFWMFDNIKKRFKLTTQPPLCPSGLLCRLSLERSVLEGITSKKSKKAEPYWVAE